MDFDLSKLASQGLDALTQVAPTLAGMVGGPLAGTAVSALESALGLSTTGDANAALAAVAGANPDQLLRLKAEDNRHAEALQKAGIDLESIMGKDRDSARQREMVVRDSIPATLGVLTVVGFFASVAYILAVGLHIDGNSATLVGAVIGYASAKADLVLSYYFGSSKGADDANRLSAALTGK